LLFHEALELDSTLDDTNVQVHMGYWSGSGNRDRLAAVLDAINSASAEAGVYQKAIWDEGTTTLSSDQYPQYVLMNQEYWYERGNGAGGIVTIEGVTYVDPYPVTFAQADDIWGGYSQRYADMAANFFETTGRSAEVWCCVIGARATRIFYTYELPELRDLEAAGSVLVHFAVTTEARWDDPSDWITGTGNAPAPAP